jgi:hypothetical protein
MSRDPKDLTPRMQKKLDLFTFKMVNAGHPFLITSTYRSQEEQNAIYGQGRTTPGEVVTWTRHSRHTQRDAFDIALLNKGEPVWSLKFDVDEDGLPDYLEAAEIGESCGLTAGYRWKNKDAAHFEDNGQEVETG